MNCRLDNLIEDDRLFGTLIIRDRQDGGTRCSVMREFIDPQRCNERIVPRLPQAAVTGTLQQDHRVAPTTSQSSQRAGQAPPVRSWRYVLQMAQFGGRPEYPAQNDASRRGAGRVKCSCALVPHRQLTLAISPDSPGPRCSKTVEKSNVAKIPTPQYLICFKPSRVVW